MEKFTGAVKWFDTVKGFGFIAKDDGGSVFVHHSAILMEGFRQLNEGDQVTFSVNTDDRGRVYAEDVFVTEEAVARV
jgi:CspA family cold shock protein